MNPSQPTQNTMVQVVQHLRPGGLECLVLDFLRFAPANSDVRIIALEGTAEEALNQWPTLRNFQQQLHFMNKRGDFDATLITCLKQIFTQWNVSTVHTHHIGPLLYAGIAAKLANVPQRIHTEHDAWHLNQTKHRLYESALLKWVKPTLVADAPAVAQALQKVFPSQAMHTIANGIDTERFRQWDVEDSRCALELPPAGQGIVVIGCAGRLEKVKGHDVLIKAMSVLPKHFHLAIAGSGSQHQALQQLISALGLENRVTLLGAVEQMPQFYSAIDLFCLPSRAEGFPLSALEAQSCGVPTLVTDVGSSKDTLCPITGSVSRSNHPFALAKAIEQAASKHNQTNPRAFIREHFDVRQMLKHYHSLSFTGGAL